MSEPNPGGRKFLLEMLPQNSICAEVGVWTGTFSKMLLNTTKPEKLFLIDPWLWDHEDIPFDHYIADTRIAKCQSDMDQIHKDVCARFVNDDNVFVQRKFSVPAAEEFQEGYFDWVYLDGAHDYDSVIADIEAFRNTIKVGGLFCFDDYDWGKKYKYPVRKAVDELIETKQYKKIKEKSGQFIAERIE